MQYSPRSGRTLRTTGKSSLLVASLLAVLLGAGVFVFIYFFDSPRQEKLQHPELKKPAAASRETDRGSTDLSSPNGDGEQPPSEAITTDSSAVAGQENRVPQEEESVLRLFGAVTNTAGEPIENIRLRWIATSEKKLESYLHDALLLGEKPDLERLREKDRNLRAALASSLDTASDPDGKYQLHIPGASGPGVLLAAGTGYAPQIFEVHSSGKAVEATARGTPDAPVGAATETAAKEKQPDEIEVLFSLNSAGAISGEVTDGENGDPAVGMIVVAGLIEIDAPAMMNFVKPGAPRAGVAADGTYKLQGLPPGTYRVVPRTADSEYVSILSRNGQQVVLEDGLDVEEVNFRVSRGGRVFGWVTDGNQDPVSGARCSVMPTDFMARSMKGDVEMIMLLGKRTIKTDGEGYFERQGLPLEKPFTVSVVAEDYAPATSEAIKLSEEETEAELNLTLSRGFSISGYVQHEDGNPAANVRVATSIDVGNILSSGFNPSSARPRSVRSDDEGAFTLSGLGKGEYGLEVGKAGLPTLPFGGFDEKKKRVVIDGTGDVTGIVLTIEDENGLYMVGNVTDSWGKPIEGVSIRISSVTDFAMATAKKATTDENGQFTAANLKNGPFKVEASKSGYATEITQSVEANAGNLSITLLRNGTINGRIVTSDRNPLGPGGKVTVEKVEEDSALGDIQRMMQFRPGKETGTAVEGDGTFSIEAPAGKVQVQVVVPGFAPARSRALNISPGDETTGIEIVVMVGAVLHGKVTSVGSIAGVEGAQVAVKPFTEGAPKSSLSDLMPQFFGKHGTVVVTHEDGLWEIPHLAAGKYAVTASHDEYAPADPRIVIVGADEVKRVPPLVLTVGAVITGTVTEKGDPKAGILVQILGAGVPMKQGTTDAEGVYEFKGLKAGEYAVRSIDIAAMQKGRMAMKSRYVVLENGDELVLDVVFGRGSKIFGTVKGLPASPMRMVTLRRPGGPAPEELDPYDMAAGVEASKYQVGVGMTRADGKYEIIDIEPGTYILEITKLPANPTDLEAYKNMDRKPHYRHEITLKKEDLEHNIEIR